MELIDQAKDIIEENIQDFSEGMTLPNNIFLEENECDKEGLDNKSKMLQHHYHLNQSISGKFKDPAIPGIIPHRLHKVQPPNCSACQFLIQNRTLFNNKGKHKHIKQ